MGNTFAEPETETLTFEDKDVQSLIENDAGTANPYKVILFNDESHTGTEVALQIIKAIKCSNDEALRIMLEAHKTGRAIVYVGGLERCEHVEAVLAEIRLHTKIEQV